MTDWDALTKRTLAGIEVADPTYRPTNFWGPGVRRLLGDLETLGLDAFKSWPTATDWFYPTYGNGISAGAIDSAFERVATLDPGIAKPWFRTTLNGGYQARRDFDAARLAWDQSRWPFDLEGLGESEIGKPSQIFRLTSPSRVGWTRPYLNYLLCLAALSRHVDAPPKRFLEIGGGYGVLGEIVLSRDPTACYVDLDLPPLLTVASFYLDALFEDRVTIFDEKIADAGSIELAGSACLPNWRIADIHGPFDAFINSFSFQEMEPAVVEHYVNQVALKDCSFVVSLNSKLGKPKAADGNEIGVVDPVTSDRIVASFEANGYELLATYGDPLIQSAGELVVLRRRGIASRPGTTLAARPAIAGADYRAKPVAASRSQPDPARSPSRLARFAHDWMPPKVMRATRAARSRRR